VICDFTAIDFPVFVCVILILISGDEGKISGCRGSRRTKRDVVRRQYEGDEAGYDYGKVEVIERNPICGLRVTSTRAFQTKAVAVRHPNPTPTDA
jgi:hypothetical protein